PKGVKSGLNDAVERLHGVEGIGIVHLSRMDIVRHRLVTDIVHAYENDSVRR
ncbi:MAG: PhoH family protein, partial [Planctomycetota bacterium]|nr:PhoH family protein [Planctomycetota bacterium]